MNLCISALLGVALLCVVTPSTARSPQNYGSNFGNYNYGAGGGGRPNGNDNSYGGADINPGPIGGSHYPVPLPAPIHPPRVACRYWCKTDLGQTYCCEDDRKAPGLVGTKPGNCPPTRLTCPRRGPGPPATCSNDGACYGNDKCCFDKCLEEHVCKPPQPRRPY